MAGKLLTHLGLTLFLSAVLVTSAVAQTIENTGPDSDNSITIGDECTIDVDNNTEVDIDIDTDQDADSGDASNSGNTGGGDADSGDANNDNSVTIGIGVDNGDGGVSCEPVAQVDDPEEPETPTEEEDEDEPEVLGEEDVNVGGGDIADLPNTNGLSATSTLAVVLGGIAATAAVARVAVLVKN